MNDIEFSKEIRGAIKSNDTNRLVSLLESDKSRLNMVTPFGTWLHVAARAGNLEAVKRLVEMGADINKRGGTFDAGPLNIAVSYGQYEIVRYLLSSGAELDVSEPYRNPLFGAIYHGDLAIAKMLVEHGIDWHMKYSGETMKDTDAISYARELGQLDITAYLESIN